MTAGPQLVALSQCVPDFDPPLRIHDGGTHFLAEKYASNADAQAVYGTWVTDRTSQTSATRRSSRVASPSSARAPRDRRPASAPTSSTRGRATS
jgi:hypothetical protein